MSRKALSRWELQWEGWTLEEGWVTLSQKLKFRRPKPLSATQLRDGFWERVTHPSCPACPYRCVSPSASFPSLPTYPSFPPTTT